MLLRSLFITQGKHLLRSERTSRPKAASALEIRSHLKRLGNRTTARVLQGFFKTGPGEYGEGDIFLGIKVPVLRQTLRMYPAIDLENTLQLLRSPIHEERLLALLALVRDYSRGSETDRDNIYKLYLANTRYVNNWDLVDLSAPNIVGVHLLERTKQPLYKLAKSHSLWERRIAIVSTAQFIRNARFNETLRIAGLLLRDKEDLIHKAVGWMLREVGKRDMSAEEDFLKAHHANMPRTMLRYSIERFPEPKRQMYLNGFKLSS